jgi:hypothetical protein
MQPERAAAGSGPRKHPRITDRMPAFRYSLTTRDILLENLDDALMQRMQYVGGWILDLEKIKARLQQSLWAVALNSPDSVMTRDMQRFMTFIESLPPNPPRTNFFIYYHDAIMRELRKLGKQALFIIAVHIGIIPRHTRQHARMRAGGGP